MKFILEFVSCCGSSSRPEIPPTESRPTEETGFLMPSYTPSLAPVGSTIRFRRKRRRLRARRYGSTCSDDWRPTLDAIYEDDDVVMVERKKSLVIGSERITNRKVTQNSRRDQLLIHTDDDYRRYPVSAMGPAFTASTLFF